MEIVNGDVSGPGLQLEQVMSACALLTGALLCGPSAKGLETALSL